MKNAKIRAAQALAPVFADFHSLAGLSLRSVWQSYVEGSLEKLVFKFEHETELTVIADENDDSIEIVVRKESNRESVETDVSHMTPWRDVIGRPFKWGWVTLNQQGYCDGVLLSFTGAVPELLLNVVASSIKVGNIAILRTSAS